MLPYHSAIVSCIRPHQVATSVGAVTVCSGPGAVAVPYVGAEAAAKPCCIAASLVCSDLQHFLGPSGVHTGPAAVAAPYVGAEAAAKAAKEAVEAADKAAQEAAEAEAAAAADGATPTDTAAADATNPPAAATPAAPVAPVVSSITGTRIRRPGETWTPADDDDNESAGDMMVPVLGIGAAYQQPGRGGRGPNRLMAPGYGQHVQDEQQEEAVGEKHSGGGVVLWHAGRSPEGSGTRLLVWPLVIRTADPTVIITAL